MRSFGTVLMFLPLSITTIRPIPNLQAAVMGFNDTFMVTALLALSTVPLMLFLGKPPKGLKVDVH